MSILNKVIFLFLVSITLMFYLSMKTNTLTDEKIELIHTQKYIQASKEIFDYLINDDTTKMDAKTKELDYERVDISLLDKDSQVIYEDKVSFGSIKIYKKNDIYLLYMQYLDDELLYFDKSQNEEQEQQQQLNNLIIADIFVLFIMLFIILKILSPLKTISKGIKKFGSGNYSYRLKPLQRKDEISEMIASFNSMAENLEKLIVSRTQFLSDISHELRTPIAKAKITLEMIDDSKYREILKKAIAQMDELTNELLELEKLNSENLKLDFKYYSIDTILAEVFSKMIIDEDEIEVEMKERFSCNADLNYLAIAIKNLIDNAIKYKESGKVKIKIENESIEIANIGKPLSHHLEYYTGTFTQEESSRTKPGYGLGLNIVKRVLEHHNFQLEYQYEEPYNKFIIYFV
ncbi:ArsS family sensor histidine kinase [Sulfurovum sp. zt1-1]|uniref:histidine kinase n=1 Tax=Sulfurovum zhangzhouensis TaxID=3019067 RepID=A0ABT7QUR8_9BACT|nr:ArsS family sensor histidine kinase [Sulfurovum zhangzhouensis]MDM5270578.1 ArsS family sensor histidine kinase [Sulfurovum zhangzhouensis]